MAVKPKYSKPLRYGKKQETKLQEDIITFLRSLPKCGVENIWGRASSKGRSDIKGCIQGRYFVFEIKTNTGKADDEQILYLNYWKDKGAITGLVRSVSDVKGILTTHGYC